MYRGSMKASWKVYKTTELYTKSGGHCMSEWDKYYNQDKTDTRRILKYFMSVSPNLPVELVKILAMI